MAFGIDDAIGAGLKIINKFIPDPEQKIKAEKELRDGLLAADRGQMEVNKAEAAHRSIFVAGWRPAIGWACASALWFQYVLVPIAIWVAGLAGHDLAPPPKLDQALWGIMSGMLGLAGMRTYEKFKGIAK